LSRAFRQSGERWAIYDPPDVIRFNHRATDWRQIIMTKRDDMDWRQHVVETMLPRMEADQMTGLTPGPANPQPLNFGAPHIAPPDDPLTRLPDAAAAKLTAIGQIATDLNVSIPKHEQLQELRLEITVLKNRLADLKRPLSEGGSPVPATAWQVEEVERQLKRAERELARQAELAEIRGARWTAAAQLYQGVRDWVVRGIPGDCTLDVVPDAPVSELLKKNETLSDGVQRFRQLLREHDASTHRVNSQQWPVSVGEADAAELIARRAEAGRPILENAIEHGLPVSFATTRLSGLVHNVDAHGAVTFIEQEDAVGLICWLLGPEILKKMSAEFREISDGDALDERQRAEALATISADRLATERREVACIWAAAGRGEIIDFRSDTTPMCAIGVSLRTVTRATELPPTSPGHSWLMRR
jgi:hypothetical protein